jgi:hypothetical protein
LSFELRNSSFHHRKCLYNTWMGQVLWLVVGHKRDDK